MKRINMHGGPNVGKSTISHRLFCDLKIAGYDIEFVPEFVKTWARLGQVPAMHDQPFLLATQQKYEHDFAMGNTSIIVSECPLLTCAAYGYNTPLYDPLLAIAANFEESHPSINILLNRIETMDYIEAGRFETLNQAKMRDNNICATLDRENIKYFKTTRSEYDKILEHVIKGLNT